MKPFRAVIATGITEGIMIFALWKYGAFPLFYLMITAFSYGFAAVAGMFFLLTWALVTMFLLLFSKRSKN